MKSLLITLLIAKRSVFDTVVTKNEWLSKPTVYWPTLRIAVFDVCARRR